MALRIKRRPPLGLLVCLLISPPGCGARPDVLYVDSYYLSDRPSEGQRRFSVAVSPDESDDDIRGRLVGRAIVNNATEYSKRTEGFARWYASMPQSVVFTESGQRPGIYAQRLGRNAMSDLSDRIVRRLAEAGFVHDEHSPDFVVQVAARYGGYFEVRGPSYSVKPHYVTTGYNNQMEFYTDAKGRADVRTVRVPAQERRGDVMVEHPIGGGDATGGALGITMQRLGPPGNNIAFWEGASVRLSEQPWLWEDHVDRLVETLLDEFPNPTGKPRIREID